MRPKKSKRLVRKISLVHQRQIRVRVHGSQWVQKLQKLHKEGKKKHNKLQSKEVRRRMKRNDRRYHHSDANDSRPNWLKRLFPKKRPSAN